MNKIFFLLLILANFPAFSQKDLSKDIDAMQKSLAKQRAEFDSIQKVNDSLFAIRMKQADSAEMVRFNEQNTRNLNSFVSNMKEREQKQKRAMWLRIGAGLLFLVIGIYGVTRKRRPKTGVTGS